MKLLHPEYPLEMIFEENYVQRLVIESPKIMAEFVLDFKNQIAKKEGRWILSQDGKVLNISDVCEFIIDIFDVEINQRKSIGILYDALEKEINESELFIKWREILASIESVLNCAIDNMDYDICYQEMDIKQLFKSIDIQFKKDSDNYVENLLQYMELMSEIRKIKIFILLNASSFLTVDELKYLYEQSFYKKYNLLLIDSQDIKIFSEVEQKIIIDKDACVIDINMK